MVLSPARIAALACVLAASSLATVTSSEPDKSASLVDEMNPDRTRSRSPAGDVDGDGISDLIDNCISVPNEAQDDTDTDTVGDACDNCLHVPNPNQSNVDGDAVGDLCEHRLGPVVLAAAGGAAEGAIPELLMSSAGQCSAGTAVSEHGVVLFSGFVPAMRKVQETVP